MAERRVITKIKIKKPSCTSAPSGQPTGVVRIRDAGARGFIAGAATTGCHPFQAKALHIRALLGTYPGPSSGASEIVAALREAGPKLMAPRCWDEEEMGIPPRLLALTSSLSRTKAKRDVVTKESRKRKADAEPEQPALLSKPPADRRQHADASACMAQRNASTNSSDHAAETEFRMPSASQSPVQQQPEQQQQCSLPEISLPSFSGRPAAASVGVPSTEAAPLPPPRPSVSCQAGGGIVLPPSCLGTQCLSSAAASMSSISPFDLHMPSASSRRPPLEQRVDDTFVNELVGRARGVKHAADRERAGRGWTVHALCKYVESSLIYMEACEHMMQGSCRIPNRIAWLSSLYGSTATLLSYTVSNAETAAGPDLAKEALRILAERLCAVCQLREAVHSQGRIGESAARAQQLSIRCSQIPALPLHQQQQPQLQHAASGSVEQPGGGSRAGAAASGQPSTEADSTTSSQDNLVPRPLQRPPSGPAAAATGSATAAASASVVLPASEGMLRLVEHAKQVARFSGLLHRSPLGFQTFIERPDYRDSQAAKLASLHIATLSMDMGMADGFRLLSHASRARACIALLCR